jgi:hypothetical protein
MSDPCGKTKKISELSLFLKEQVNVDASYQYWLDQKEKDRREVVSLDNPDLLKVFEAVCDFERILLPTGKSNLITDSLRNQIQTYFESLAHLTLPWIIERRINLLRLKILVILPDPPKQCSNCSNLIESADFRDRCPACFQLKTEIDRAKKAMEEVEKKEKAEKEKPSKDRRYAEILEKVTEFETQMASKAITPPPKKEMDDYLDQLRLYLYSIASDNKDMPWPIEMKLNRIKDQLMRYAITGKLI